MKGGTYSEALDAKFTADQAGFLARLSIETQSEVENRVEPRLKKLEESNNRLKIAAPLLIGMIIGLIAGLLF